VVLNPSIFDFLKGEYDDFQTKCKGLRWNNDVIRNTGEVNKNIGV